MKRIVKLDGDNASWRCEQCFRLIYCHMRAEAAMVHADDDSPVCDYTYAVRAQPDTWASDRCGG